MTALHPSPTAADQILAAPWRWFSRTFAVAVIAHVIGNPAGWRGDQLGEPAPLVLASAAVSTLAVVLLVRPGRWALGGTAVGVLVTLWLELPVTGNHWLVMGFVAAAVLVSLTMRDPWAWLSVTGRWILLAFYSFAAFAKLNTGFLDPGTSCGVFYANHTLASFGLPTFEGASLLGTLAIIGPVVTELSVPVLLAFTRTRRAGVLLALTFHTVISLDFDQHFYDFTAVLVVLLCLFLPESTTSGLEARTARASGIKIVALLLVSVTLTASLLPASVLPAVAIVRLLGFGLWVPFAAWLIIVVARDGLGPAPLPMRLRGAAAPFLVALVVGNALTPYLELKTAVGFNMYANLVTVGGETNHLVVPRTLHLSDVQDDLLEVVASDDRGLRAYAEHGYLVPERNLLDYLSRHPDTSVIVRDEDGESTLDGTDGVPLPVVVSKLLAFRAVDMHDPPRCQAVWLPAL